MSQDGLLVSPDEGRHQRTRTAGIQQEDRPAEQQSLPDDDCDDGQVHGVSDVPVQPADHQPHCRRGYLLAALAFII